MNSSWATTAVQRGQCEVQSLQVLQNSQSLVNKQIRFDQGFRYLPMHNRFSAFWYHYPWYTSEMGSHIRHLIFFLSKMFYKNSQLQLPLPPYVIIWYCPYHYTMPVAVHVQYHYSNLWIWLYLSKPRKKLHLHFVLCKSTHQTKQ